MMHDMGWLVPVLIVATVMARGAFTTWVRAKHGYPLENGRERRGKKWQSSYAAGSREEALESGRTVALLTSENERLHGQVGRLEERIAVLERIVTDPAERTAREIDALR